MVIRRGLTLALLVAWACGGRESFSPPLGPSGVAAGIRLIAPLSTSTVTSQQPTLRWVLANDEDEAQVDVCADRSCSTTVMTFAASGSHATPPSPLAPGVYFWRARSLHNGVAGDVSTPVWEFWVGHRSAAVDSSWGTTLDVNGDGPPDLVVGSGGTGAIPAVYIYLGTASGFEDAPTTTLKLPDSNFGFAVASAGDVDGDGFGDLLVQGDNVAYVYRGGPTGVEEPPWATLAPSAPYLSTVAAAGDVNGDGFGDLIVGATDGNNASADVFFGSADAISTTPVELPGPQPGSFEAVAASAGDVDGDGFGDVMVYPTYDAPEYFGNAAYVFRGGPQGPTTPPMTLVGPGGTIEPNFSKPAAADFDGDGYADIAIISDSNAFIYRGGGSGPSSMPTTTIYRNRRSAITPVAAADVNGDGFADLVVGAESPGDPLAGVLEIYPGGTDGSPPLPPRSWARIPASGSRSQASGTSTPMGSRTSPSATTRSRPRRAPSMSTAEVLAGSRRRR
jgi:hypothetical protein